MENSQEYLSKRKYPIRLGGAEKNRYQLILYENRDKYQTLVNILYYDEGFKAWQCMYSEVLPYVGVKFYNRKWDEVESKVLVLYSEPMGSGGFISYEVIGKEDDAIKKLISQQMVFQGTISFREGQLVQGMGSQFKVWKKEGNKFVLKPYEVQPYPGAYVVKFSIVDEDTVEVDRTQLTVLVGSVIQFIREDFNDITDRILFSNDENCLSYLQFSTFKITCPSTTTVTIIPSAYNWQGAKEVVIITT